MPPITEIPIHCDQYSMAPKLVALELDYTIWFGRLSEKRFDRGRRTTTVNKADNLELVRGSVIRNRCDHRNTIDLFPDVPDIITDLVKHDIHIAIVSRATSKALCDRALWLYRALDKTNQLKPIISLVRYDEVRDESKIKPFRRIKEWSGIDYSDMLLFDSTPSNNEVQTKLGVTFKLVKMSTGLRWEEYQDGLTLWRRNRLRSANYIFGVLPRNPKLGPKLGSGKFSSVYVAGEDLDTVIKVFSHWDPQLRPRFLKVFTAMNKHLDPLNNINILASPQYEHDSYLMMIAFELRNLRVVAQLKAPHRPEEFSGWFAMCRAPGTLLWKTPLYKCHPFSKSFQVLLKTAFNLIMDEIEDTVEKYGIEHRDAHLANVMFIMQGNMPVKAHLFDWGFAVRMKWDGHRYIRGNDIILWGDREEGLSYTPREFRRYWIGWMVKTEYEANVKRSVISKRDAVKFLKDIEWWFE